MKPTKPGGGNLPQLYDPENGQYTDEEKTKLLEDEIANIVMRYIFGLTNTYEPRYPIYGFHNKEYCELYIRHAIYRADCDVPVEKVRDYLLKHRDRDDKSSFFKTLGYDVTKWDELHNIITANTDFSKMEYDLFNEYGLRIDAPVTMKSLIDGKEFIFYGVWRYDRKDRLMHFITVDLKKR
jgi:hypothetical protein